MLRSNFESSEFDGQQEHPQKSIRLVPPEAASPQTKSSMVNRQQKRSRETDHHDLTPLYDEHQSRDGFGNAIRSHYRVRNHFRPAERGTFPSSIAPDEAAQDFRNRLAEALRTLPHRLAKILIVAIPKA